MHKCVQDVVVSVVATVPRLLGADELVPLPHVSSMIIQTQGHVTCRR